MNIVNQFINKPFVQDSLARLSNPKALAPVVLLELSVTAGRSYQAKKRGGYLEFRERLTEELTAAVVWLWGVTVLNKAADFFIKHIFKLDTSIDLAKEKEPLKAEWGKQAKHIIKGSFERLTQGRKSFHTNLLAFAKFSKVALSAVAVIYFIGAIIPKINQKITRRIVAKKIEMENLAKAKQNNNDVSSIILNNQQTTSTSQTQEMFRQVQHNTVNDNNPSIKGKNISFTNGALLTLTRNAGYALENNNVCKLLTADTGVTGGRSLNARNKYERSEIIFRDVVSIPFYMFTTGWIIKGLVALFDKKHKLHTNIDPRVSSQLHETLKAHINGSKTQVTPEELQAHLFGEQDAEKVTKTIDLLTKADQLEAHTYTLDALGKVLRENNVKEEEISRILTNAEQFSKLNAKIEASDKLMEFANKLFDQNRKIAERLLEITTKAYSSIYTGEDLNKTQVIKNNPKKIFLQKLYKFLDIKKKTFDFAAIKSEMLNAGMTAQVDELTKLLDISEKADYVVTAQLEQITRGGLVNNLEFLNRACHITDENIANPKKYTSRNQIQGIIDDVKAYTEALMEHVKEKGKNLEKDKLIELLETIKNKNTKRKLGYFAFGFGISALFLSTLIPKVQYYITKKRTGKNKFPGVEGLEQDIKAKGSFS